MDDESPTALDLLIGTSPHVAMCTDYGIFCPACSDPFKSSFVLASACLYARNSAARTDKFQPWSEAMVRGGLRRLPPEQRSQGIEAHQAALKKAQLAASKPAPPPRSALVRFSQ